MRIALDAMGGDFAPAYPVHAAVEALKNFPAISRLVLVGDEEKIRHELSKHGAVPTERLHIFHTTQVVAMDDSPVEAVRKKKDSSMCRAVDLVKEGAADAIVSAGNTGALLAASTIKLRTLPGVDRAALAVVMPKREGIFVLMDAGASVDAKPENLVDYAIMGEAYCRHILRKPDPKIGVLSNGSEEGKGNKLSCETYDLLKETPVNFIGNVEGHALFDGQADVIVCDGFVGNITLKTIESLSKLTFKVIKEELTANFVRLAGAMLVKSAFRSIAKKFNADDYGGALLLGVNGIVIKAHGSSSVLALYNSLRVAVEAVDNQVNPHIVENLAKVHNL
ncbi:MAG: phosphate acyltransferase PlsX [Verrucomicrobiales bacterium]|jgi:glycerol-3-phosphate acyltransferase PlsX|nr:phosphate acyltransferase PlsX [Verrucomicrobiales bacterium]